MDGRAKIRSAVATLRVHPAIRDLIDGMVAERSETLEALAAASGDEIYKLQGKAAALEELISEVRAGLRTD